MFKKFFNFIIKENLKLILNFIFLLNLSFKNISNLFTLFFSKKLEFNLTNKKLLVLLLLNFIKNIN